MKASNHPSVFSATLTFYPKTSQTSNIQLPDKTLPSHDDTISLLFMLCNSFVNANKLVLLCTCPVQDFPKCYWFLQNQSGDQ